MAAGFIRISDNSRFYVLKPNYLVGGDGEWYLPIAQCELKTAENSNTSSFSKVEILKGEQMVASITTDADAVALGYSSLNDAGAQIKSLFNN
jgi:hypothetical protein